MSSRSQVATFRAFARRHPLPFYVALAYAWTWACWIPLIIAGDSVVIGGDATHVPGLFGPMIAALVVTGLVDGRRGLRRLGAQLVRWRVGWRWAVFAIGSPLLAYALFAGVIAWSGRTVPPVADLGRFNGIPAIGVLGVWLVLLASAFGEETGWRGFALPALERSRSPLRATGLLTLIWAGWHVPAFFLIETYRQLGVAVFPGFLVGLAAGAVLFTWLFHRTSESILMVSLWHASYNLVSGTAAGRGVIGASISAVVIAWAAILVIHDLRTHHPGTAWLSRRPASRPGEAVGPRLNSEGRSAA